VAAPPPYMRVIDELRLAHKESVQKFSDKFKSLRQIFLEKLEDVDELQPEEQRAEQESLKLPTQSPLTRPPSPAPPPSSKPPDSVSAPTPAPRPPLKTPDVHSPQENFLPPPTVPSPSPMVNSSMLRLLFTSLLPISSNSLPPLPGKVFYPPPPPPEPPDELLKIVHTPLHGILVPSPPPPLDPPTKPPDKNLTSVIGITDLEDKVNFEDGSND
ncbi:hypothetical protein A2U01_0040792, partial [Trifolium medium]|nr:hypothetical protein [Trifolium medium]